MEIGKGPANREGGTIHAEPSGPERRIGPYRILRELGHGGGGTVYLAARADDQFQKRVAIKVIPAGGESTEAVRHFKRERQILASLSHPHIAQLLDGGTTDQGVPYFVMEHIDGEPLLTYADSRGLSVSERLKLFLPICSAVEYAHRNLVVHRDIKPSNVLVTAEGSPRLLDFGIAKLQNPELMGEAHTGTAMAMTPEYASPEQARGERITTATDVYSLGVVLYELLTGLRPYAFRSRNALDVLRAVAEQPPTRPSAAVERLRLRAAVAPEENDPSPQLAEALARCREGTPGRLERRLRGDLDTIVMMALRKEPQKRYPSVGALAEDISRHLGGLPVAARKGTAAYRASKFVRRHRLFVTAAAVVLVLLVAFPLAMAAQSARVARQRDVARKERAAAQKQRETAQRVSKFLVSLFKVSNPSEARGNTVTAREVLDKGAQKITTELKDQPEIRATLMDTIGDVYRNLGLYDQAVPLLQEALESRRAVLGPDHPDVAATLNHLANLLADKGDYATAETLHREALAIRRNRLGNESAEVATSLTNLANVIRQKGDYPAAEAMFREALALNRKVLGDGHLEVATSLNNLAIVLAQRGNPEAEALFREALALRRRLLGSHHPDVANGLNNLASMLYEKKEYREAEALHREALAMWRTLLGNENPRVGVSLIGLAETLWSEQRPAEAEPLAREALAIFRKTLPGGHPYIAVAESVLGGCLTLSRRYSEAEPLLLGSHRVLQAKTGRQGFETRQALQRVVDLYDAWGKADQAARYRAELTALSVKPPAAAP